MRQNSSRPFSQRVQSWIGSTQSIVIHTILFVTMFALEFFGIDFDTILLILTTAVSLEAIYLAIFIQMTVNQNTRSLQAVEEDIDEIQEDVDEFQTDVDEIQVDVDEIEKDDQEDEHRDLHNKQVLEKIEPETVKTSRLYSVAKKAVMSEPDFSAASTTSVASEIPAIIRLRSGKFPG